MTTSAKELFEASVDLVRRGQVRQALTTLLDALAQDPGHIASLEAAGRLCRILGAPEDATHFEDVASHPQDPQALYALGYRMVDQGRPDVALTLLESGLEQLQDESQRPAWRRELAYAQYLNRDFVGCLGTLSSVEGDATLSDTEQLDVRMLQAEAALYAGRRSVCLQILDQAEQLVPESAQRSRLDALHGLVGRASHWPRLDELGLREWHFIQHAGVILKTAGGFFEDGSRAGRFEVLALRIDMLAFLLVRLAQLLERLDRTPELLVPASPTAAPLAHALAQHLDLGVAELHERGGRSTLLMAAGAGELAPLSPGLARHRSDLKVFSLSLDWTQDQMVCPDVVGVLAERVVLPWEPQYRIDPQTRQMTPGLADERPPEEIGSELARAMVSLPDDGGRAREDFEAFYLPLADELVLANEDRYPSRRQFSRLSPCWKPTGLSALDKSAEADG